MKAKEKCDALRRLMEERGLSAYYVPTTDPHQGEYVPDCWKRRHWLSGFTGSNGDLVVTANDAALWTDGRYFLQAGAELRGSGIRLCKMGEPGVPTLREYLVRTLKPGEAVGVDPQVISILAAQELEQILGGEGQRLVFPEENLVDLLWTDRPAPPEDPVRPLPTAYAGETTAFKLRRLRRAMKEKEAAAVVLSALDSIAWLYNIRGWDTLYNPVAISYALVTDREAVLFIDPRKVPPAAARLLAPQVRVRPYGEFASALRDLAAGRVRVWADEKETSRWVADQLAGCILVRDRSPVTVMKARKNPVEVAGIRAAARRDGVAMVRFLRWLETAVPAGGVTEVSAAEKLDGLRAELENFQRLSFDTISGYAGHGAIVHYRVTSRTDVPLKPEGIYLIDSGGQYLDGTTDITRTVLLGKKAAPEQRDRYTRVLQGHIALARASFPAGVSGIRLDTLARLPLWQAGLDYNHGTGHGIGHYLCVHEGPQSISPTRDTGAALEAGNVLSNEPGYYEAGAYGLRIENMVLVVEDKKRTRNGNRFLGFETLSLCPIDRRLIEPKLLNTEEKDWLNAYHRRVLQALSPQLGREERAWLRQACAPVK